MWLTFAVLLMTLWSMPGCGAPQEDMSSQTVVQPPRVRFGNLDRSTLRSTVVDLNGDGEADQWSWLSGSGTLFMVERDLDFDGTSDMFEYFEGNTVVEQEFQLDFDRAIDMVAYYANGQLVRKEMSCRRLGILYCRGTIAGRIRRRWRWTARRPEFCRVGNGSVSACIALR